MKLKVVFLFLIFLVTKNYSQETEKFIFAKIIDSVGAVENANIINLRSKLGTSSNTSGEFKIKVKIGDSLQISSVQHVTKYFIIDKISINKRIDIILKRGIEELEGFELNKRKLMGILDLDLKNVPETRKGYFNIIFPKLRHKDDFMSRVMRQKVRTDPNLAFIGVGFNIGIPFRNSEKHKALVRKLEYKKNFPRAILLDFGVKFFSLDLKIPPENYYQFIEYCSPLGIEDLYKKNKKLDVIKILRKESVSYLKIINAEKN